MSPALGLLDVLMTRGVGRANAVPLDELAQILGTSTREVQHVKHELVKSGYQIGSTCGKKHGLFVIADEEDRRIAARQIRNRIRNLAEVLRAYDKSQWVKELLGQITAIDELERKDFSNAA